MKLIVATQNKGKIKEIRDIFKDNDVKIITQNELNINMDVEEDGCTFEENAFIKANAIMKVSGQPTIADDSGLEVDYLNGAPGIYSARYSGSDASDEDRIKKLLKELDGVKGNKRSARFVCVIVALFPDGNKIVVRGECKGMIGHNPIGTNGFGYDPIFYIPEYDMTMAQMQQDVKNKISHRAKALKLFKKELRKYIENKSSQV